jgi:hypothetical protein
MDTEHRADGAAKTSPDCRRNCGLIDSDIQSQFGGYQKGTEAAGTNNHSGSSTNDRADDPPLLPPGGEEDGGVEDQPRQDVQYLARIAWDWSWRRPFVGSGV